MLLTALFCLTYIGTGRCPWPFLVFDIYVHGCQAAVRIVLRKHVGDWVLFDSGWTRSYLYTPYLGYMRWFRMMEGRSPVFAIHQSEYEDDLFPFEQWSYVHTEMLFPALFLFFWRIGYSELFICATVTLNEGRCLSAMTWLWTPPRDIMCVPASRVTQEGGSLLFEDTELRNPASAGEWDYRPLLAELRDHDILLQRVGTRPGAPGAFAAGREGSPACHACENFACDYVCIPCGHYCLCGPCASRVRMRICPVCQQSFTKLQRVLQ